MIPGFRRYVLASAVLAAFAVTALPGCSSGQRAATPSFDAATPEVPTPFDASLAIPDAPPSDRPGADVPPDGGPSTDGACQSEPCLAAPPATAVFAGQSHTCALFATGQSKCWGDNSAGQLGLGDSAARGDRPFTMGAKLPVVDVGTGRVVQMMALGTRHTCALLDHGQVKCWGDNTYGQLGFGHAGVSVGDDPAEMGDNLPAIDFGAGRTATAIAAGPFHTCAILDNGALNCWGRDNSGNLGLGGQLQSEPPAPGQFVAIDLGTGRTAKAVSAGGAGGVRPNADFFSDCAFTCAVLDNGQIKCWGGLGFYGTLGVSSYQSRGAAVGDMGDGLLPVELGKGRATGVSIGSAHVCATLEDRRVMCWGNPHMDQTGWDDKQPTHDSLGNLDPFPAVKLGTGRTIKRLVASANTSFIDLAHTCALLDNDDLKCWGANLNGELGQGDTKTRGGVDPTTGSTMGDALAAIDLGTARHAVAIAAGGNHTCAVLDDGHVKCWGLNKAGQLGIEQTVNVGDQRRPGDGYAPVALW